MKNWNSILRWIHLIFGFTLNLYLFQTVFLRNEVSNQLANIVFISGALAFWTGVIKWQLPRIRKWRKGVSNA